MSSKRHRRRQRHRSHRAISPGTVPGSLSIDPDSPHPVIHVTAYSPDDITEADGSDLRLVRELLGAWPVTWVHVSGLGDAGVLTELGSIFGLHPLSLEDVVNLHQRAKVEHYGDCAFVVVQEVSFLDQIETEQLSLFVGRGFVLSFEERAGDCLDPVRERIRMGRGRIRGAAADYLAYAILDAVIDGYFPTLERYGEHIEVLEDEVIADPGRKTISRVLAVKHDLLVLRRAVWPLRDALSSFFRDGAPAFGEDTRIYLRDCYDHVVRIMDLLETYRELAMGLMDLYLSSVGNRMNEVMKVLTIIATIFIPLSFIAGLYGMNFETNASPWNMPELGWRYGYPFVLALMAFVALSLVVFFWRRGWIGRRADAAVHSDDETV